MTQNDERVPERVRDLLAALPGLREVDFTRYPEIVSVRCDAPALRVLAAESIGAMLNSATGNRTTVQVDPVALPGSRGAKRARFESLDVSTPEPGRIAARVVLEWQRARHEGHGEGEASLIGELRAAATATTRALEMALGDEISFSLIGVKELHVFDHDLIAVLLHSARLPNRKLIGTSIITDDRRRSAALAVLNATNRAVGNLTDSED